MVRNSGQNKIHIVVACPCKSLSEDARYLYLRDDCSGQAWCVGESPIPVSVDDYSCEHTLAYSRLASGLSSCTFILTHWLGVFQNWAHLIALKQHAG